VALGSDTVVTLKVRGLIPATPSARMREATVLWLVVSPFSCRSWVTRLAVGATRDLVEAEDLGVKIAATLFTGQRRTALGLVPAVVTGA
jgi:hypothetical protein